MHANGPSTKKAGYGALCAPSGTKNINVRSSNLQKTSAVLIGYKVTMPLLVVLGRRFISDVLTKETKIFPCFLKRFKVPWNTNLLLACSSLCVTTVGKMLVCRHGRYRSVYY